MSINVSDVGKVILVNAGYDLSGNSELSLVFLKPDGTTKVTKTTADGVSAPTTAASVTVDGEAVSFAANEYFSYVVEAGLFDTSGAWKVQGIYADATPKNLAGDFAEFSVFARL